jgi:hypothetical protein
MVIMGLVRELCLDQSSPLLFVSQRFDRPSDRRTFQAVLHLPLHMFGIYILGRLQRLGHATILGVERSLKHVVKVGLVLMGLERMSVLTLEGSKERQKNLERVESVIGFWKLTLEAQSLGHVMSDRGSSSDDSVDHQTCPAEQVNSAKEVTRENLTHKSLQRATCMDVLSGRVREEREKQRRRRTTRYILVALKLG